MCTTTTACVKRRLPAKRKLSGLPVRWNPGACFHGSRDRADVRGKETQSQQRKMIFGIGTDLIETERVRRACRRQSFLTRCFTEEERRQAAHRKERLAGDFAVKEAVAKAFHTGFSGMKPSEIACLRDETGAPYVVLSGNAEALRKRFGISRIHVSITNTGAYAAAFAVLEQEENGAGQRDE